MRVLLAVLVFLALAGLGFFYVAGGQREKARMDLEKVEKSQEASERAGQEAEEGIARELQDVEDSASVRAPETDGATRDASAR